MSCSFPINDFTTTPSLTSLHILGSFSSRCSGKESACLNWSRLHKLSFSQYVMSCGDMKSDSVSRTSNQLPSTNEKMPAVYTTHKIVNRFLCLRTRVPECQVTNKVNKKRDKRKHRSQGKKNTEANVYSSFLEGKRHKSLAKQTKLIFLMKSKL